MVVRTPSVIAHARIADGVGIRFGYITGKRLGGAVMRNKAKRRFRELTKGLITDQVGDYQAVWVMWRLQPVAASATVAELERDIAQVWTKVLKRTRT